MGKRGLLVYKALVVIIGGALIIAGFLQGGKSYGNQEAYYKLAVAKDLALMIDLMHALPGNIEITYPNDVSGYDVEIKDNVVMVYRTGDKQGDRIPGIYTFADSSKNPINVHIKNQNFIKLEKSDGRIIIKGADK